jgi:hypothetical protein
MKDIDYPKELRKMYVGNYNMVIIHDAADEIERLRAERDEARRKFCQMMSDNSSLEFTTPQWFAEEENWDCYKKPYCFRVKGVVVSKEKAVPPKFELGEDDK